MARLAPPASPYRAPAPSPPAPLAPLRLLYFPCAGLWPLLLALIVGLPLAYWARHDARVPSVVTCSTIRGSKGARSCLALDARTSTALTGVDCRETPEIFARVADLKNPFSRPIIWATETRMPGMSGAQVTSAYNVECKNHPSTTSPVAPADPFAPTTTSTVPFGAYEGDGMPVGEAEAMLQSCAASPDTSGPARTLSVTVMGRNYLRSVLVLLGCLLAALGWMVRRRTRVTIDVAGGRLRVVEYGLFLQRRMNEVGTADTAFVEITSGLAGPINGKRVELMGRGGARLPLVDLYAPLTTRVHEVTARKIREALHPELAGRTAKRRSTAQRFALAALVGTLAGAVIGSATFYLRTHRGTWPESWEGKTLVAVNATHDGSTVVLARLGTSRLALVADKEKKMVRVVDAPTLMNKLGDPAADRLDGKLASAPGPMVLDGAGRLFVALPQENAIAVLEVSPLGKSLQETARLATEAEPVALALTGDGATLVVISNYGHALQTFEARTLNPRLSVELSRSPRSLALSADGRTAYVTHDAVSELTVVDLGLGKVTTEPLTGSVTSPPTEHVVPTVSKDGRHREGTRRVYRADTSMLPTVQAQVARVGDRLFLPSVYATISDPLEAPPRQYYGTAEKPAEGFSLKEQDSERRMTHATGLTNMSCLLPEATLVDEDNQWLYLACDGPGQVYKLDVGPTHRCFDDGAWGASFRVGGDPTGMALDRENGVLVVWSQVTQTLTTLPLDRSVALGVATWARPELSVQFDPAPEWLHPLRPSERDAAATLRARGRDLFYATHDPEVSASGVACASCHLGGRDDGQTWPTEHGPRQTPMLAGRLDRTAPYGWAGDASDLHAYLQSTFARLGGKDLPRDDEDALVAYMRSIPPPHFTVKDAGSAVRGKEIFQSAEAGCATCHAPGQGVFTDTERHDVKSRIGVDSTAELDTPSLLYIGGTAPYFHDGRYATLAALLGGVDGTMGHTGQLDDAQRGDLLVYLRSIGGS